MNAGFVIVGAGQAGARAAQAMRGAGYEGPIKLIGDERTTPYERPPLSKEFLTSDGSHPPSHVLPPEFFSSERIDLRMGARVAKIEPARHRLECDDGVELSYDRLLLATGSRARTLDLPGITLEGVFTLRDMSDAAGIRERLRSESRLVVVGGGFLGLEVAASARRCGLEVTVLEREGEVLQRVLPTEIGGYLAALHRNSGVEVRCGVNVASFDGADRLEGVRLDTGEYFPTPFALVSVGGVPNTEFAAGAGIDLSNGIGVNEYGETGVTDIFAAGEVTRHPSPMAPKPVRLESWQVAQNQSVCAARTLCGQPEAYREVPWFWSDQYDVNLQMAGFPTDEDDVYYRGERQSGRWLAAYFRGGELCGAVASNSGSDMRAVRKLLATGARIDPEQLTDPGQKLKELLKRGGQ